ncbi:MAG TPA: glycosyltransferase family 4 protein [Methylomirabilota bacterium]|nr:glycosyltransferase family 4 protein [Methylomirabilota bacterium]
MRVLFDHPNPFLLAHGGFQTQIEQTKAALERLGIEVEWLQWWNATQRGDIIHYFGRPAGAYIEFAHQAGIRVVVAELLTGLGSRPRVTRWLQKAVISASQRILPYAFVAKMAWDAYRIADACVALTAWEARLMQEMFGAPSDRVHVVPNGVEQEFLTSQRRERGPWLVCTATITERKRVVELAEAATRAQTPLWIIGRPYDPQAEYTRRFEALVRQHPQWIRYEGAIHDRVRLAQIYREARGFVLLSTMESLSLSALEAAACETPLLLGDLPWARTVFGAHASYCPVGISTAATAMILRRFYDGAPQLTGSFKPLSWDDVARQFQGLYEKLLRTSS